MFYFTGKPCRNGHIAKRRTSGRNCVECNKQLHAPKRLAREMATRRQSGKREVGVREKAVAAGETTYFTGRPCKNGHITKRYVMNAVCSQCEVERHAKSRQRKPSGGRYFTGKPCRKGHIAERDSRTHTCIDCRRAAGRTKGKAPGKYFTGKPCRRGHVAERYLNTSKCVECIREDSHKNYRNNPEYYISRSNIRGYRIKRATPQWADAELLTGIYQNCPEGYHVDHIIPITHELVCGLHVPDNLQQLPATENLQKSNKFTPLFA